MQQRLRAERRLAAYRDMRHDPRARADARAGTDHDERPDPGVLAEGGVRVDDGRRVDPGGEVGRVGEHLAERGHRDPGTRREKRRREPHRLPVRSRPEDGGACPGAVQGRSIGGRHCEGEVPGTRCRRLGRAPHADRRVAGGGQTCRAGDLGNAMVHRC